MEVDGDDATVLCSSNEFLKSPLDPKEYRVVRHHNGLRAILCSSVKKETKADGEKILEESGEYQKIADFNSIVSRDKKDCPAKMSSSGVTQESDQSYGAIVIGVGGYHSPLNFPGMAHLCEHALLLGSPKYPNEDEILYMHREIGGSFNAYTFLDRTAFFFDCSQKNFSQYLDRISDFLVNPKMTPEALYNEVSVIECEYLWRKNSDGDREYAFLSYLANNGNPQTNFTCGNESTLSKPDLHYFMSEWIKDYYSPCNITLALTGPYSLDNLEDMSKRYFAHINQGRRGKDPHENDSRFKNPFYMSPNFCGKKYLIIPFLEENKLIVSWGFDNSVGNDTSTNAGDLISHLFNTSGYGSLKNYLFKWGHAHKVSCQHYVKTNICSLLNVQIDLTDEGTFHIKEIIDDLFSYIGFLKEVNDGGFLSSYFGHYKNTHYESLHYNGFNVSVEQNKGLAETSQGIPQRQLLTNSLPKNYDYALVSDLLDELTPESANILIENKDRSILGQDFHWDKMGQYYYSVDYSTSLVDPEWIADWNEPRRIKDFHLPPIDSFVNSEIYSPYEKDEVDNGTLTFNKEGKGCIKVEKYKFQDGRIAEAGWNFKITSGIFQNPERIVDRKMLCIMELWIDILKDEVAQLKDFGLFSRVNYSLSANVDGSISISLNGTCYKLDFFFRIILQAFIGDVPLVTPKKTFENKKADKIRTTLNAWRDAKTYADDVLSKVIIQNHVCKTEYADTLSEITYEEFMNQTQDFQDDMFIYGDMKGVVPYFQVESCLGILERFSYRAQEMHASVNPESTYSIHHGEKIIPLQVLEETDNTSCIVNYYQMGKLSTEDEELVKSLCFNFSRHLPLQLRVQEQLGYKMFANHQNDYGTSSIIFYLITNPDKFCLKYINFRMDKFLERIFEENLERPKGIYAQSPKIFEIFKEYLLPSGRAYKKISVQVTGHKTEPSKRPIDYSKDPTNPLPPFSLFEPNKLAPGDNFGIKLTFGENPPVYENYDVVTNITKLQGEMNVNN